MQMTRYWSIVGICLIFGSVCPRADAWNNFGHMLTARIAWEGMTPTQRTKAVQILHGLGPNYDMLTKGKPASFADEDLYAFVKAATWPDMVRSPGGPMHAEHRAKWHYINFPINLDGITAPQPSTSWVPGQNPENAVQAMPRCENDLKTAGSTAKEKAIALCWMLHLMGDIHQPLHATALFSDEFPEGDGGGNLFIVDINNKQIALHTYWDTVLSDSNAVSTVSKRMSDYLNVPELKRGSFATELTVTDYAEWTKESLALDVTYEDGGLAGQNEELLKEDPSLSVPAVDMAYAEDALKLARKRVAWPDTAWTIYLALL